MKVIKKVIEAEFKGHCDLSKQEDRIAFLGLAISTWENYDIKEIRRVLKDLSALTELAERDGTLAKQAKRMKMVERREEELCKKCDKHCNHKKTAHSSTTIHKGEDGVTATIDAGGMSEEEIRKEIDRALGLVFEKLPDNDEEEEDA